MDKGAVRTFFTQNALNWILIVVVGGLAVFLHITDPVNAVIPALWGVVGGLIGVALSSLGDWWKAKQDIHTQLRFVALDKRLAVHQEAYEQWTQLVAALHQGNIVEVARDCRTWWNKNCLYLTPEARKALSLAISQSTNQAEFAKMHAEYAVLKANWDTIMRAGDIIEQSVSLPPFSDFGAETLKAVKKEPKATA